ncbi:MAG: FAD-binding oxidoreductase [Deltaproteobacteria bacterium]
MQAIEAIEAALPTGRVVRDESVRAAHAHDYWALEAIRDHGERKAPPPACVVFPESTEEVSIVLRLANEAGTPVVPYGLGSGVCGAVRPGASAIVLDLSRMNSVLATRSETLTACVQAGMRGSDFEAHLASAGLTLGHFPQSIEVSTVGGWVATRASGQFSTRYGNIEEMVLALEVVLADGRIMRTFPTPRSSTGPDLKSLILGSEGTLGVVTEITFKVWPKPTFQTGTAFRLKTWEDGLEITRELLRDGWRPVVLRLYDGTEANRNFGEWVPESTPMLLMMTEGSTAMEPALELEMAAMRAACEKRQGVDLGDGALQHWLGHRNTVPSWDELLAAGLVVDTIEIAATWDRIGPVYEKVTAAIAAVPGILIASGHTSHAYPTGVNIYFTFIGQSEENEEQERIYSAAWNAAMEATMKCGGTIAHHHGIGRVRRDHLPRELGEGAMAVLHSLKKALDPKGILNPDVLM